MYIGMDNMRRDAQESTIAENYQALTALVGWIVEAMEFVPLPDEAKSALDVLLSTQKELQDELARTTFMGKPIKDLDYDDIPF